MNARGIERSAGLGCPNPHAERRGRSRHPRHALRAWPEIARALRKAETRAIFLDFDGTLARIRRHPEKVRCSRRIRDVLARLARGRDVRVSIVSGRRARTLARLIRAPGVCYRGVYGAEQEDRPLTISAVAHRALSNVRSSIARQVRGIQGVWMENKGLSFVIHYRCARQGAVAAADGILRRALAPAGQLLRRIAGRKSWEVLPREIPGKGAAVAAVMKSLPSQSVGIYIGDAPADEEAFSALPHGITIRIGRSRESAARYFLRGPTEVWKWLMRLEQELP